MHTFTLVLIIITIFATVVAITAYHNFIIHRKFKLLMNNKETVTGIVKRETKGGYQVTVSGTTCFCPNSQIGLRRTTPGSLIGKELEFHFSKVEPSNYVLTRRELLKAHKRQSLEGLKSLTGQTVTATVESIKPFGIFVLFEEHTALIPASEISWNKKLSLSDAFTVGQTVTAKVLSADPESGKIALSTKAMNPNPITEVRQGKVFTGPIVRVEPYGLFQEIGPSLVGLVHKSTQAEPLTAKLGETVTTEVLSVNYENKRISLRLLS